MNDQLKRNAAYVWSMNMLQRLTEMHILAPEEYARIDLYFCFPSIPR
jgi:hypothetical protein